VVTKQRRGDVVAASSREAFFLEEGPMLSKLMFTTCAVLVSAGLAFGQTCPAGKVAEEKGSCSQGAKAACSESKSACCQDKGKSAACCNSGSLASLKDMPQLLMKVGEETTACCDKAKELAKGDASKIQFVVGGKTYGSKAEAQKAYAAALDEYLNKITTVQFAVGDKTVTCPMSADQLAKESHVKVQYAVAAHKFDDQAVAAKAAKQARDAADKVAMKWAVGDKTFCCDKMAKQELASCKDKKIEYVVGEVRCEDEIQAKVQVARARLIAAVEAVEKAGA
jgi:hypothetical protein